MKKQIQVNPEQGWRVQKVVFLLLFSVAMFCISYSFKDAYITPDCPVGWPYYCESMWLFTWLFSVGSASVSLFLL